MQKRRLRNFSLLALVALVAHFPALFGVLPGYLPSTGDTLGAFVPWHTFAARSLTADGQIPLWNPTSFVECRFWLTAKAGFCTR